MKRGDEPELTLVMPVMNEAGGIEAELVRWHRVLSQLGMAFRLHVYDDGSTDATPRLLEDLAARMPELRWRRHPNRGHGPTVLRGYREADSPWVAQADSDGEIPPTAFAKLWQCRGEADLVLGARAGRRSGLARRLVSRISRGTVRWAFGGGAGLDVNTPFRLMRAERLAELVAGLADSTFAPNVIVTGRAVRRRLRVVQVDVPHHGRQWGTVSLGSWRLWRGSARALRQTITVAISDRVRPRP